MIPRWQKLYTAFVMCCIVYRALDVMHDEATQRHDPYYETTTSVVAASHHNGSAEEAMIAALKKKAAADSLRWEATLANGLWPRVAERDREALSLLSTIINDKKYGDDARNIIKTYPLNAILQQADSNDVVILGSTALYVSGAQGTKTHNTSVKLIQYKITDHAVDKRMLLFQGAWIDPVSHRWYGRDFVE